MRFFFYVMPPIGAIAVIYLIAIHVTMRNLAKTYPCTEFDCNNRAVGLHNNLPYCQEHLKAQSHGR